MIFADWLTGLAGRMDKHGAGIDKLFHFEILQGVQQAARPFDIDGFVKRVVLTGEVEIGNKMDYARDARAMFLAESGKRRSNRILFGEVDPEEGKIGLFSRLVEADNGVGICQRRSERPAYIASRTGDEDYWLGVFAHHFLGSWFGDRIYWLGAASLLERSHDLLVPANADLLCK